VAKHANYSWVCGNEKYRTVAMQLHKFTGCSFCPGNKEFRSSAAAPLEGQSTFPYVGLEFRV